MEFSKLKHDLIEKQILQQTHKFKGWISEKTNKINELCNKLIKESERKNHKYIRYDQREKTTNTKERQKYHINDFLNVINMLENLDEVEFSRKVEFTNLTKEGINNLNKSEEMEEDNKELFPLKSPCLHSCMKSLYLP